MRNCLLIGVIYQKLLLLCNELVKNFLNINVIDSHRLS